MIEQIGEYRILEMLGQGGMGQVFLGEHVTTHEQVAIKMLLPNAVEEDPTIIERLRREGEALQLLNHPNIVKMIDVVEVEEESDNYAIIMEFVSGGNLHGLATQKDPLPLGYILKMALELADALTRAHHLKIIHRDLKPANILLAEDGSPRLTDFGVARMEKEQNLTQTGSIVGSASYLSPEMIMGEPVDARADIWAFGVILYELIAGERLFEGKNPGESMFKVMSLDLTPLTELRPETPPALNYLVLQMLERNPEERIGSMRKVAAGLEDIINELPDAQRNVVPETIKEAIAAAKTRKTRKNPTRSKITAGGAKSSGEATTASSAPTTVLPTKTGQSSTNITQTFLPSADTRRSWGMGIVAGVLVVVGAFLGVILFGGGESDSSGDSGSSGVGGDSEIVQVEPVADGEVMVLVAQLEPLDAERPRINQFLVDNLIEDVELGSPLARAKIRPYPAIIRSEEDALTIAAANNADMILWGNYAEDLIEINFQVNTLMEGFTIPSEYVASAANVRVHLEDERTESLAGQTVGMIFLIQSARSDVYSWIGGMVAINDLVVDYPETVGNTPGTYMHLYLEHFFDGSEDALDFIDQAILLDGRNPLLHHLRGGVLQRLGENTAARESSNTSLLRGGENWLVPRVILAGIALRDNDYDSAIEEFSLYLEKYPDDWFALSVRGGAYYLKGDYEAANADNARSITLNPRANIPYVFATMIAIREGRVEESREMLKIILNDFDDPTVGVRLVQSFSGTTDGAAGFFGFIMSAFSNLTLGQYQAALEDLDEALALQEDLSEVYLMQGAAYCLSKDYLAATESYTKGLELNPDFTALYVLRADAYQQQNKPAEALADITAAQQTSQWANFEPMVTEALTGDGNSVGCESFFGAS